jgi:DNA modification methylase
VILHQGRLAQWGVGDCRDVMKRWVAAGVRARTCVTSPPYFGLRDYGHEGQLGLESTPEQYVNAMVEVFRGVRDVLTDDGTLWLNIGDSYAANRSYQVESTKGGPKHRVSQAAGGRGMRASDYDCKPKDLIGIPWMLAFALRADGWYLRQEIIWAKSTSGDVREGSSMPESVRDRCAKSHEQIFLLAKSERYFFDVDAIKEPAKDWGPRDRSNLRGGTTDPKLKHAGLTNGSLEMGNRRSVWRVSGRGYSGVHFAVYPPALIEPCILAGSAPGDIVLDPFGGSGTTAGVALKHGRNALLCELNAEYAALMPDRIRSIVA